MEESHSLTSDFATKIHNQNSMVLAQKQIPRSMEKNRDPRNKPIYLQSIYDKGGKNIQQSSISGARKTGQLRVKE